jgi:hypothetical protein
MYLLGRVSKKPISDLLRIRVYEDGSAGFLAIYNPYARKYSPVSMGDGYQISLSQKTQFYLLLYGDALAFCYSPLSDHLYLHLYFSPERCGTGNIREVPTY